MFCPRDRTVLEPCQRRRIPRRLGCKLHYKYSLISLCSLSKERLKGDSKSYCKQSTKFHHYFKADFLLWVLCDIFVIPQTNQTSRRGNVTNYMAPPSPGARDSHSPSRSSPSGSSKSVPGYMQPTRSSGASKGSGTPRARKVSEKRRWCRRPFIRDYFLTIE